MCIGMPPGVNQIAVDKYIISYHINLYHIISYHISYIWHPWNIKYLKLSNLRNSLNCSRTRKFRDFSFLDFWTCVSLHVLLVASYIVKLGTYHLRVTITMCRSCDKLHLDALRLLLNTSGCAQHWCSESQIRNWAMVSRHHVMAHVA